MSGFAGIVNFDGAPVDRELISRMAAYMAFRGPDEQRVWIHPEGHVAFAYAKLTTTFEMERETQPCTMDGKTYLVGHIRVDARDELWPKLEAKGFQDVRKAPDANLVWMAYQAWGERCVDHLIGDFSFAIWDDRERKLFCARDHMGVRLFYYSHQGETLIFSNTLDCVRMHPEVTSRLNDLAIVDFLLFGYKQELQDSYYFDISSLTPAHHLRARRQNAVLNRYWQLPVEEPIYLPSQCDYLETTLRLMKRSLSDRSRDRRIGIFMSGGLDSPALAAMLLDENRSDSRHVKAYCYYYDNLIDDPERHQSELIASSLQLPIEYSRRDDSLCPADWREYGNYTAQPSIWPYGQSDDTAYYSSLSSQNRTILLGEGPDDALTFNPYAEINWLLSAGKLGRLAKQCAEYTLMHRRLPLQGVLRRLVGGNSSEKDKHRYEPLATINRDLVASLRLKSRIDEPPRLDSRVHKVCGERHLNFLTVSWVGLFDLLDPCTTGAAIEVVHPYLDLRLLRWLLAVPLVPYGREKLLLRRAMKRYLPKSCLNRRKSPLRGDPWMLTALTQDLRQLQPHSETGRYVVTERLGDPLPTTRPRFWPRMRLHALNYWFYARDSTGARQPRIPGSRFSFRTMAN